MSNNLAWYANLYGMFFEDVIELGGVRSAGPGGFSHTFFTRSQDCVFGCGACCRRTFRDEWHWLEGERRPDVELSEELFTINGQEIPIYIYKNQLGDKQCDFLNERGLCNIHLEGTKPVHCLMSPQVGAYEYSGIFYLSKRLPSRNWRWPQCPINLAATPPPDEKERAMDRQILTRLSQGLGMVKGCILPDLLEVYDRLYDPKEFLRLSNGSALVTFKRILEVYK